MRSSISAFALLVGVLVLIGCGAAKEKEYRKEANAICAEGKKRLGELPRPSSLAQVERSAKREMEIREGALADLGELQAPKEIAGGATEIFSDLEARQERTRATIEAAKHKDRKELRKIRAEGKKELKLEAARARAFNLPQCAGL